MSNDVRRHAAHAPVMSRVASSVLMGGAMPRLAVALTLAALIWVGVAWALH